MTIEIGLIFALVGCIIGVITFFVGRQSAAKKDGEQWGSFTSEIRGDISNIKDNVSEIKAQVKINGEQYSNMRIDVEIVKRDLKTAFNNIDDIKKGVQNGQHRE